MFDSLPSAAPHIRSGIMRAIAVSGPQRSPTFPDIPTIAESYPSIVTTNWFGMAGPAGVPDEIVTKMHASLVTALSAPDIKSKLADLGVEPGGDTPDGHPGFRAGRDRALGQGDPADRNQDQLSVPPKRHLQGRNVA